MEVEQTTTGVEDTRDIAQYIAEENARERGQEIPVTEPVATTEEATTGATAEAGESTAVADKTLDKRTREGRAASIQADLDALTRDKHQAERDLAARKAELAALTPAPVVAKPVAVVDDPEPKLEEFATDADPYTSWLRATHKWDTRQELRAHDERQQQATRSQQMATAQSARLTAHETRYAAALAADPTLKTRITPEFHATMIPLSALPMDQPGTAVNAIAEELIRSEYGAAMEAHLSDHPDRYRRLATLPTGMTQSDHALAIIREMAILETEVRLAAADRSSPARVTPVISAAKPPLKLVGTSPVVSDDGDDEGELDTDEYIRRVNARERSQAAAHR